MALKCPQCGTTACSLDDAENLFGRRTTQSGEERWQSWCYNCRKRERKMSRPVSDVQQLAIPSIPTIDSTLIQAHTDSLFEGANRITSKRFPVYDVQPGGLNELWRCRLRETANDVVKLRALYIQEYPNDKANTKRSRRFMFNRLEKRYAKQHSSNRD